MATKQIIKALKISDIRVQDIIIGTKKTNKIVNVTLNNKPIVFQTPFLQIKGELRKTTYPNIYQIDTIFDGDTKHRINQWYQFLENLENHITTQIINNGSEWFSQKDINIKSLVRSSNGMKDAYVKWAIDLQTNIFLDEDKKSFNPHNIKDKDSIKLIVEISNLWIKEDQCGLAAVVQKILVKPFFEKIISEYIFDDSDSENDFEQGEKSNDFMSLLETEQKVKPLQQQISQATSQTSSHIIPPTSSQITPQTISKNQQYDQNTIDNSNHRVVPPVHRKCNTIIDCDPDPFTNLNENKYHPKKHMHPNNNFFEKERINYKIRNFKNKNKKNDSDDEVGQKQMNNCGSKNRTKVIKQLVDEYSQSSEDMNELNEDDLDFEN